MEGSNAHSRKHGLPREGRSQDQLSINASQAAGAGCLASLLDSAQID